MAADNKADLQKINDTLLKKKYKRLNEILTDMGELVVGFSGGVDSTFLLRVAADILGRENVLAVTSCTETYPSRELKEAKKLAETLGVEQIVIHTSELDNEEFTRNDNMRCYYCKKELFSDVQEIAEKRSFSYVADGSNYDDKENDYRPGMKAARELGVRSPLMEAKMKKCDIRELSRRLDLPTWDKPSFACLSSRFPYGNEIKEKELKKVDRAEEFLCSSYPISQLRVRNHDENTARIEVLPEDMETLLKYREEIVKKLKELGYVYITFDIEGYRTGSMNEVLGKKK
ncbi:MAG: ATP-dependent sacrificial sulfur transferase LarE [Halanaerobiales bacterium]